MNEEHWIDQLREKLADYQEPVPDDLWAGIEAKLNETTPHRRPTQTWLRWAAAAAITLLIAGGSLLLWDDEAVEQADTAQFAAEPTEPDKTEKLSDAVARVQNSHTQQSPVATSVVRSSAPASTTEATERGTITETETITETITETGTETGTSTITETETITETITESGKNIAQTVHQPQNVLPTIRKSSEKRQLTAALFSGNGLENRQSTDRVQMSREMAQKFMTTTEYNASRATSPIWLADYEEREHHNRPIAIGLQVSYPVHDRLSVKTGIVYTKLESQFSKFVKGWEVEQQQSLHYIGIPLGVQYRLLQFGRLSMYASAGGQADWNVSNKTSVNDIQVDAVKDRCQWSLCGSMGLTYNLTPNVGLFVEPGIRHYFDNHSDLQNFFKDKPTCLSLQLGLQLNIGMK